MLACGRAYSNAGLRPIEEIGKVDLVEAVIAYVNVITSPGVEGSTLHIARPDRQSDMWRSSLGFASDFTIKGSLVDGFWGAALVGGAVSENIQFLADNNSIIDIDAQRDVIALRASLGIKIPLHEKVKIRTYFTGVISEVSTASEISGDRVPEQLPQGPAELSLLSEVSSMTTAATAELAAYQWIGASRADIQLQYTLNYTDTFSKVNPILDSWGWSRTSIVKTRITNPTGWYMGDREWRWLAYLNHTDFVDQSKAAIGFTHFYELGLGLEWEINMKPLDWFPLRYVGFKAGYIEGDDITGYNIGITMR
ncbi:hypothetical protein SAMN02745866_01601 [Alteromonadaceae bacterium Bs31]|nr:hypothetical protein SAMN02745866_01601 [Alteromonadaceae bacterium Bs31]